ncbi:MAG TPA: Gfo/Idh/MocA family oxidoreductase, partial [Chthonomonadales bacterium]|nr:Gfo/Idh/MocA family oxidoreductase [Chthonomonadales bacterium]
MSGPGPERVVRLGVIGAGSFASRRHLPDAIANPEARLEAICRRDAEALAVVANHFGLAERQTFRDWQKMLDTVELDAALIATPNALHYQQAEYCLERGLHVLVEKPMTLRANEARRLCSLARSKNLILSVALNPPFWPHCRFIKEHILAGRLGRIESVSLFWSGSVAHVFGRSPLPSNHPGVVPPTLFRSAPELNGGGYFADGGGHLISEALWVSGLRASRVSAMMDSTPVDMRTALSLELENGAMATILLIGDTESSERRVRHLFSGSAGAATVVGPSFATELQTEDRQVLAPGPPTPGEGPVANFVNAILHSAPLKSPPEHGVHVTEVLEAAYQAAASGKTV